MLRLLRSPTRPLRRLRTPAVQLVAAVAVMVGGAYLIALWAVGVVLIVGGLLWAADALLRDSTPRTRVQGSHADVIERWRQAR